MFICIESKETVAHSKIDDTKSIKKILKFSKVQNDFKNVTFFNFNNVTILSLLAHMNKATSWDEVEKFINYKNKKIKDFLKINYLPEQDLLRRFYSLLNNKTIENMSFDTFFDTLDDNNILDKISFFSLEESIYLISKITENPLTVIDDILSIINLSNSIISFDILDINYEIIDKVVSNNGNYICSLKRNILDLYLEGEACLSVNLKKAAKNSEKNFYEVINKNRNEQITEKYYLVPAHGVIVSEIKAIQSFICYEKTFTNLVSGKGYTETKLFFSNLKDVSLCSVVINNEWGFESKDFWHLDYHFQDNNFSLDDDAYNNFLILNKVANNITKVCKKQNSNEKGILIKKILEND